MKKKMQDLLVIRNTRIDTLEGKLARLQKICDALGQELETTKTENHRLEKENEHLKKEKETITNDLIQKLKNLIGGNQ